MKIYTKQGDLGQTQVYLDKVEKFSKAAPELACYGSLDELNAHIGLLIAEMPDGAPEHLHRIQQQLFQLGFAISANGQLQQQDIEQLEHQIDEMQQYLPHQTGFILPGGHKAACQAHICRTVSRRAERQLVALMEQYEIAPVHLGFINRLSDYFFVLARYINHQQQITDTPLNQ